MGNDTMRIAVVTGGHSFDVVNFHRLWRSLDGIDAYIQHLDDYASSKPEVRAGYDAVVFYTMLREGPVDEGLPWYCGKPREALSSLGESGNQGIVVLHHALLAYPDWEVWREIVGFENRSFGYEMNQTVDLEIADSGHPITQGLEKWRLTDETYDMPEASGSANHVLITTDHPKCVRTIAWTRDYHRSRVFCFQSGHDDSSWSDATFREVVARGIRWTARRL
jgi:uncharacterized protein